MNCQAQQIYTEEQSNNLMGGELVLGPAQWYFPLPQSRHSAIVHNVEINIWTFLDTSKFPVNR